jgi:ribosomal protein S10
MEKTTTNISNKNNNFWQYKVQIKSHDFQLLELNLLALVYELKKNLNFLKISKLTYLPNRSKKFSVLRSPFVDNSSREHFELKFWKIVVFFEFSNSEEFINKLIENL